MVKRGGVGWGITEREVQGAAGQRAGRRRRQLQLLQRAHNTPTKTQTERNRTYREKAKYSGRASERERERKREREREVGGRSTQQYLDYSERPVGARRAPVNGRCVGPAGRPPELGLGPVLLRRTTRPPPTLLLFKTPPHPLPAPIQSTTHSPEGRPATPTPVGKTARRSMKDSRQ